MFFQPAPEMIEHHGGTIENQREKRWAGESGLAAEDPLEEANDVVHVRHEEGEPEGGDEVKGDEPR